MPEKGKAVSRRDFFKRAGAAGVGSVMAAMVPPAYGAQNANPGELVPTRPFGKTGVEVSALSLGGMFDISSNQLLLRQAVKMGVTYWDTAAYYSQKSESGIGKYFAKYPEDRKKIFRATKSSLSDPAGWEFQLENSLENMKTAYVDLFLVHMIPSNIRSRMVEIDYSKAESKYPQRLAISTLINAAVAELA